MSIIRRVVEQIAQVMPDRRSGRAAPERSHISASRSIASTVSRRSPARLDSPRSTRSRAWCTRRSCAARSRKGVIERIETTAAEQAPGVIEVVTHLNAPAMKVPAPLSVGGEPSAGGTSVKILNTDRVTWNGQPIAVVVADTEERADYAASLVRVTYTMEQAVTSFEAAIAHAQTPKDVLGESPEVVNGDPDAALRSAAHRVDLTFTTPPTTTTRSSRMRRSPSGRATIA